MEPIHCVQRSRRPLRTGFGAVGKVLKIGAEEREPEIEEALDENEFSTNEKKNIRRTNVVRVIGRRGILYKTYCWNQARCEKDDNA